MKLQVSFDMPDLEKALELASHMQDHLDIIEVGSLLIYKYGETAISQFRSRFPEKVILADTKIVDRGKEASRIALLAGADWVTVLAGTSRHVIHSVCTTAHDVGKRVMLDLIDSSSPGQSALEAESLGVDAILFHRPSDEKEPITSLEQWEIVKGNTKLPVFISGIISRESIEDLLITKPYGIVVSDRDTSVEDIQYLSSLIRS